MFCFQLFRIKPFGWDVLIIRKILDGRLGFQLFRIKPFGWEISQTGSQQTSLNSFPTIPN